MRPSKGRGFTSNQQPLILFVTMGNQMDRSAWKTYMHFYIITLYNRVELEAFEKFSVPHISIYRCYSQLMCKMHCLDKKCRVPCSWLARLV